ncbi:ABC transporter substrate-binding protein [Clostridium neonatale]|uniref:Multiple sugar-binding protein n=2 Tax=Clostridium neonatale TaxID=137838 RepID=A0A650MFP8_9CLOT|nr:extracellular solute-binding protein [Clostridium neonatale]CAG9706718.1 Multiple sugar-binding protein [Clostridium neonatale]CAI3552581.1 raffinose/stachyose/melibiose transport system substrate-binding protein [Clostridium neonatale]CAI3617278.1 raffinose/stachyose/melibiose transport system substrate-binding protein [Clostridium neonatale]CAI3629990.1 raffinose/stachyose/melibiose transport system substrate-binding protein [Clostridium neonatale]CAI3664305.1 raffinose/stachyose/melibios
MNKNLKKIALVLMFVAMASTLLAGCGGSGDSSQSSSASGKTKLTLWHIQTSTAADAIKASVKRFMEANPEYEVEVVDQVNDSYKQKLAMAMSANQTPDVFIQWGGSGLIDYVNSNKIADLTDLMNKDNYKDKFIDAGINQCSYNGKIYAVPVENVSVADFFYNKDVFAKYGVEEPKTISELEAACDKLKENGVAPFALANATKWTGSMYYMYLATRFGGLDAFANAASGEGSFENPAFEFAGNKIQDWVKKGYFMDGFNGMDDDSGQARQALYKGDAAMDLMGSWFTGTVLGENPDFMSKLGFFPFPALDSSKEDQSLCAGTVGDNLYSISETCKDKEGAFKLIQSLLDDQALQERKKLGKIIPLKDFKPDDELTQKILDTVNKASGVQLWYDQYLPAEVAEVHKSTC